MYKILMRLRLNLGSEAAKAYSVVLGTIGVFGGAGGRSKELSAWSGCSVFSSGSVLPLTM